MIENRSVTIIHLLNLNEVRLEERAKNNQNYWQNYFRLNLCFDVTFDSKRFFHHKQFIVNSQIFAKFVGRYFTVNASKVPTYHKICNVRYIKSIVVCRYLTSNKSTISIVLNHKHVCWQLCKQKKDVCWQLYAYARRYIFRAVIVLILKTN